MHCFSMFTEQKNNNMLLQLARHVHIFHKNRHTNLPVAATEICSGKVRAADAKLKQKEMQRTATELMITSN